MLTYFLLTFISAGTAILSPHLHLGSQFVLLWQGAAYSSLLMVFSRRLLVKKYIKNLLIFKKYFWSTVSLICVVIVLQITSTWLHSPVNIDTDVWVETGMKSSLVALGVYDPNKDFQQENVLVEHHFIPWRLDNATEFTAAIQHARQANRFPLITVEPWPWNWNNMTDETLFQDIVSGKYDPTLKLIFEAAKSEAPATILLRWGHEMEMVGQYPWAKKDANGYVLAYRHVVDFSRKLNVTNILWVWSPAGNDEATYYWPGEEYVDYTGVSIYADKNWEQASGYSQVRSFAASMSQKYWFANKYRKPMIAAEVGVNDTEENKQVWLTDAIKALPNFPEVKCWVYFNQVQPEIVPYPFGKPNWELTQNQVKLLANSWAELNNGRLSNQNINDFINKT